MDGKAKCTRKVLIEKVLYANFPAEILLAVTKGVQCENSFLKKGVEVLLKVLKHVIRLYHSLSVTHKESLFFCCWTEQPPF
jgi:hypothetical protein